MKNIVNSEVDTPDGKATLKEIYVTELGYIMAKLYYPAECPFCESPQVGGAGDMDGRWEGPKKNVVYDCGANAFFDYIEGTKNKISIRVQNESGSTVDLASCKIRLVVARCIV